jgi:hypothetical protein
MDEESYWTEMDRLLRIEHDMYDALEGLHGEEWDLRMSEIERFVADHPILRDRLWIRSLEEELTELSDM